MPQKCSHSLQLHSGSRPSPRQRTRPERKYTRFSLLGLRVRYAEELARPRRLHKHATIRYVGTGKSTLAGTLATHLGFTGETPFATSDEIHAHTQAPISLVVGDIKITFVGLALSDPSRSLQLSSRSSFIRDTPGLMDTAGLDKDMRNMGLIVKSVSHSVAA